MLVTRVHVVLQIKRQQTRVVLVILIQPNQPKCYVVRVVVMRAKPRKQRALIRVQTVLTPQKQHVVLAMIQMN